MIKLIIFDWDDVFSLGSKEGYFKCYRAVLDELRIKMDPGEERKIILKNWGQPYQKTVTEFLKDKSELQEKGYEIYRKHLFGDTFINALHIIPSAKELLCKLQEKYILSLASGVQPKLLKEKIMPKFDIPNVFAHIITAHDLADPSLSKPHPHIAQEIMRLTGIPKEQTVMVGDAKNDVLMAKGAGIIPIVVLTGHLTREEAESLGVKYIISDVGELEKILTLL